MKTHYFPKISGWLFLLLLLLIAYIYKYPHHLFLRPCSIHQWRQCDCLSITYNYYQEGMKFFSPSVHWIGPKGNGNTITEFPIIYYVVALLWKTFGYHEFIFRLVNIIIVFTGLFAFFKTTEDITKDSLWAIMAPLFLFSSPIFSYYTNNFLMDAPSVGLCLIGWYYFYQFFQSKKKGKFYLSLLFFLLAGLIKISSLISLISIFIIYLISLLKYTKSTEIRTAVFPRQTNFLIPFLAVFTTIAAWYSYSNYYIKTNGTEGINLMGIEPMWEMSYADIIERLRVCREQLLDSLFHASFLYFILFSFIMLVLFYKRAPSLLVAFGCLMVVGGLIYFVLFFKVFDVHDYYLMTYLIVCMMVLISFFVFMKNNCPTYFYSWKLKGSFLLFLVFNIYYCENMETLKFSELHERSNYTYLVDQYQIASSKSFNTFYESRVRPYETITPYLRSLGIKREDKVISIPDGSINISLYLMDQKGWTGYKISGPILGEWVKKLVERGAQYLIINDNELLRDNSLAVFFRHPIGRYNNITIYALEE